MPDCRDGFCQPVGRCLGDVDLVCSCVAERIEGTLMDVLVYLIPASLILGGLGLVAFFWALKSDQFDDPAGDSRRILSEEFDDKPKD